MRASEDGAPELGHGAVKLGVRPSDAVEGKDGFIIPRDGLSVATSYGGLLQLPAFLRPFREKSIPLTSPVAKDFGLSLFEYDNADYQPFRIDRPISDALCLKGKSRAGCGYITVRDDTKIPASDFDTIIQETVPNWTNVAWESARKHINDELSDY